MCRRCEEEFRESLRSILIDTRDIYRYLAQYGTGTSLIGSDHLRMRESIVDLHPEISLIESSDSVEYCRLSKMMNVIGWWIVPQITYCIIIIN